MGQPWQSPLGSPANDRTSRLPLSATGQVRWRVPLPYDHVAGISVTADGTSFVSAGGGITALDGPVVSWSIDTSAAWSPLLLDDGLLVIGATDGLAVREQRTGRLVNTIREPQLRSDPAVLPNGLLAFLVWLDGSTVLRATTPDGRWGWQHELASWSVGRPLVQSDQVIVADGATLRAFGGAGDPVWTIDLRQVAPESGEVEVQGPLVGLSGGRILVAVRTPHLVGYALADTRQGTVHPLPAHLPPKPLAVPLTDGDRERLFVPGWPEKDDYGQLLPTVTAVDIATGEKLFQHVVPTAVRSMVGGSTGVVAAAGSPTPERWATYHAPDFDLSDDCYVFFFDSTGVRGEWQPGRPVTGPLAVGADGDLLVPISGELVSVG
ncbi:PQQ-binding-like beta-propeller repeat protein [Jiangella muralis]|uniref:PQQ-binding-like beta-propeller repeat protein n=1 Tax=Jiangella muralis TaxID=702383 RepID=UPI00069E3B23|nr:PQQ-binding-like beta-propeller repeat protein [Jiangella muralis]